MDGSSHDVDRDSCGVGDDRKNLERYVSDPGSTPSDRRGNDHDDGMGAALSILCTKIKVKQRKGKLCQRR